MAARRKEHSSEIRRLIVTLFQEGSNSYGNIAKQLKLPKSTVQSIIEKYQKIESVSNIPGRGRKRATTEREDRIIGRKMLQDRKKSAGSIAAEIGQELSVQVSPATIRNRLREAEYHGRIARKKPYIDERNYVKRVRWARSYLERPTVFWNRILWSDESRFKLYRSDGMVRVWRKPSETYKKECLQPTVKHGGGSVMVWGCMSANGVGNLVFIEGKMLKEDYRAILKENLMASARKLGLKRELIFQQDNDPKHTAYIIDDFLEQNGIEKLPWPAQSPDLNPIEHLWDEMERRMKARRPKNKNEMKKLLVETWNNIGSDVTKKLVESMPRRLRQVILNKGGPTRY